MPVVTIRQQISREVKRALSDAGLSARAAARAMGVEPKTLYRWINEEVTAPLDKLEAFGDVVGKPIRLTINGHNKEAPPAEASGAMSAFVERWESGPPPKWAESLRAQILDAISDLHSQAEALRQIGPALGAVERAVAAGRLPLPLDGEAHDGEATQESRPEAIPPRPRQGSPKQER